MIDTTIRAEVYMHGDSDSILTTATVEEVLAKIADAWLYEQEHTGVAFVRLPLRNGEDGLVRPGLVAAIPPHDPDWDGED